MFDANPFDRTIEFDDPVAIRACNESCLFPLGASAVAIWGDIFRPDGMPLALCSVGPTPIQIAHAALPESAQVGYEPAWARKTITGKPLLQLTGARNADIHNDDAFDEGKALLDMKVQLRSIADIRPGLQFREAIRHAEQGELGVVQAGDIGVDGVIEFNRVSRVASIPNLPNPQTLAAGEVLLQCRGQTYRAAVVPAADIKLVASASLLILCPRPEIRPAFLAHFLNDPNTQVELRKLATGATIANLKRSALEQLETPLPTLVDQDRIIALGESLRHQLRIEARIAELRRIELRALLEKCTERNRKRDNAPGS